MSIEFWSLWIFWLCDSVVVTYGFWLVEVVVESVVVARVVVAGDFVVISDFVVGASVVAFPFVEDFSVMRISVGASHSGSTVVTSSFVVSNGVVVVIGAGVVVIGVVIAA